MEQDNRHMLDMARIEINRLQPDKAIQYVRELGLEPGPEGIGTLWLESQLVLAEAYLAKGDPVSESFFEDVLDTLAGLETPESGLELRADEHYGDYFSCFAGCPSKARPLYDRAKQIAVGLRLPEDTARIQLKIERLELSIDRNPELDNFGTLKRVAKEEGSTYQEQLTIWLQHRGTLPQHQRGLQYARKKSVASPEYFRHHLRALRLKPK